MIDIHCFSPAALLTENSLYISVLSGSILLSGAISEYRNILVQVCLTALSAIIKRAKIVSLSGL